MAGRRWENRTRVTDGSGACVARHPPGELAGALELLPPEAVAESGSAHRLDNDEVDELAVHELLERHGPQRPQRLTVGAQGVAGDDEVDRVHDQPVREHRREVEGEQPEQGVQVDHR